MLMLQLYNIMCNSRFKLNVNKIESSAACETGILALALLSLGCNRDNYLQ